MVVTDGMCGRIFFGPFASLRFAFVFCLAVGILSHSHLSRSRSQRPHTHRCSSHLTFLMRQVSHPVPLCVSNSILDRNDERIPLTSFPIRRSAQSLRHRFATRQPADTLWSKIAEYISRIGSELEHTCLGSYWVPFAMGSLGGLHPAVSRRGCSPQSSRRNGRRQKFGIKTISLPASSVPAETNLFVA